MANTNFDNEGPDFSKFFDKKKPTNTVGQTSNSGFGSQLALTKKVKVLLVILVLGIIALGVMLYLNQPGDPPTIPTGYEFVKTPDQPTRLQQVITK
jgi:hypothetical protein